MKVNFYECKTDYFNRAGGHSGFFGQRRVGAAAANDDSTVCFLFFRSRIRDYTSGRKEEVEKKAWVGILQRIFFEISLTAGVSNILQISLTSWRKANLGDHKGAEPLYLAVITC